MQEKPKFHTYVTFKDTYEVETYALSFMNRKHRSYLAQYQCGILPLEIETGRWQSKQVEERVYVKFVKVVKEKMNFTLFLVVLYTIIFRATFLQNIRNIIPNIMELNEVSQIKTFMSKSFVCLFAKLICDIFQKRHDSLFI